MMGAQWTAADGLPLGLFLLFTAGAFFALRRGMPEPEGRGRLGRPGAQFRHARMGRVGRGLRRRVRAVRRRQLERIRAHRAGALGGSSRRSISSWVAGPPSSTACRSSPRRWRSPSSSRCPGRATRSARSSIFGRVLCVPVFEITLVSFGALFAVSGFVALWGAKRPALWAAVSAAMPVLLLTIAYWRMTALRVDASWAVLALVLAGLSAFAVERIERYRLARGLENALAFYAAATVALVSLAAAMMVREAWLTVALAIQVPALAWIGRRIRVGSIQVIARDRRRHRPGAAGPQLQCVLLSARRESRAELGRLRLRRAGRWRSMPRRGCSARTGDGRLIALLEAASLAFAVLLVSLEIRLFVAGSIGAPHYGLLEGEPALDRLDVHRRCARGIHQAQRQYRALYRRAVAGRGSGRADRAAAAARFQSAAHGERASGACRC